MEMQLTTSSFDFYPRSLISKDGDEFGLAQTQHGPRLVILAQPGSTSPLDFDGDHSDFERGALLLCPLCHRNAVALREHLPWLKPCRLGLNTSFGMGDRLGLATPGHVRAVSGTQGKIAPIFAQQSVREMQRTNRSPEQVMDDATWGIFEEGWQAGVGADADHLKTTQDIEACFAAGFTLFTLDPGEYVDNHIAEYDHGKLLQQAEQLPDDLTPEVNGLLGKQFDIEGTRLVFDKEVLLKAILKYGAAVDYVARLAAHLEKISKNQPFEIEISMDETELPTSPEEHIYIASELHRRGVRWVSFAPRFIGSFEKGVDYIGDLDTFASHLAVHAAIARQFGPYKLSLHSGSDKFSLYPLFMQHTKGLLHVKTAGTSYLEALRTIADLDVELLKEIYRFAREQFETDRLSYHISAQLSLAPRPGDIQDWAGLLEQFDARQILHVTFGSVLTAKMQDGSPLFYDRVMQTLQARRELYFYNLVKHFNRHLDPLCK